MRRSSRWRLGLWLLAIGGYACAVALDTTPGSAITAVTIVALLMAAVSVWAGVTWLALLRHRPQTGVQLVAVVLLGALIALLVTVLVGGLVFGLRTDYA